MLNEQLYDTWSATYDTQENKTRDLEKLAARQIISSIPFETVIELGCGTGKNTVWLAEKAKCVIAVDSSKQMQEVAKQKIKNHNVDFIQADITKTWNLGSAEANLIMCSLILEHIEDLDFVFREVFSHLAANGHFYICELHPFRQYSGSKARFETADGIRILECFTHHISDYAETARKNNFHLIQLNEWFDAGDREDVPRLISFLYEKI